jgi:hypothetical protein
MKILDPTETRTSDPSVVQPVSSRCNFEKFDILLNYFHETGKWRGEQAKCIVVTTAGESLSPNAVERHVAEGTAQSL